VNAFIESINNRTKTELIKIFNKLEKYWETQEFLTGSGYSGATKLILRLLKESYLVLVSERVPRDFLPALTMISFFAIIAERIWYRCALALIVLFSLILIRSVVFMHEKQKTHLGSASSVDVLALYSFIWNL